MPKTVPGKWSLALVVIAVLLLVHLNMFRPTEAEKSFLSWFTARFLLMSASALASAAAGIIALVKQKERALMVYLSTALGSFLTLLLLAELLGLIE